MGLVIRHAKGMRRVVFPSVGCLALPYFSHYRINDRILRKRSLNIKCVLIFSTNFVETFVILRRIQRDIMINVHRSSWQNTRYSCHILMKHEFSRQIFEIYWHIEFHENPRIEIRVVACGQTVMKKLICNRLSPFRLGLSNTVNDDQNFLTSARQRRLPSL
jgi:hypothetical protein